MLLTGIYLHNYKLLRNVELGITLDDLRQRNSGNDIYPIEPFTALIGRNSTGKSSLMDALSFVSDSLKHGVPYAAALNGRAGFANLLSSDAGKDLICRLIFEDTRMKYHILYELSITCDNHGRPFIKEERALLFTSGQDGRKEQVILDLNMGEGKILEGGNLVKISVEDKKYPALAAFGVIRSYPELCVLYSQISHWYFQKNGKTSNGRTKERTPGGHKHLNKDCSNIDNVLMYYREEHPRFYQDMMRRINSRLDENKPADEAFAGGDMTSGNLKLFTYLLLLADPEPRPLLCLEHPDIGLYHEMVDIMARDMRDYTVRNRDCQIIFSTHNPYMLESMHPDEVWIFEKIHESEEPETGTRDFTRVKCAGADPLVSEMYRQGVGLGSIWYGGYFEKEQQDAP